jgi:hypothetical protein
LNERVHMISKNAMSGITPSFDKRPGDHEVVVRGAADAKGEADGLRFSPAWARAGLGHVYKLSPKDEPRTMLNVPTNRRELAYKGTRGKPYMGHASTHLGAGGNSRSVVRAWDSVRREQVAVKVVEGKDRSQRAYGLAWDLDHPSVAQPLAHGTRPYKDGYRSYLVMKLADGVEDYKSIGCNPRKAVYEGLQGIGYLNRMGAFHNDICWHNVVITKAGGLVIGDTKFLRRTEAGPREEWLHEEFGDAPSTHFGSNFCAMLNCLRDRISHSREREPARSAEFDELLRDLEGLESSHVGRQWLSHIPPTADELTRALHAFNFTRD